MEHMFAELTYWHWLGLGILLMILDLVIGANFFLIWIGVAAITTAIIDIIIPGLDWQYQMSFFALASVMLAFIWKKYTITSSGSDSKLNKRSQQYIGRTFSVVKAVKNGRGKIKIGDSVWAVTCDSDLPIGTDVKVVSVNGVILCVEKDN